MRDVEIIGIFSLEASADSLRLYLSPGAFDATFARPESSVHLVVEARHRRPGGGARHREGASCRRASRSIVPQAGQGPAGAERGLHVPHPGLYGHRPLRRHRCRRRHRLPHRRAPPADRHAPRDRIHARRRVAMSFIMESSFITLLGIFVAASAWPAAGPATCAGRRVRRGRHERLLYIHGCRSRRSALAFLASLVMTIIPRVMSSIPIAEALRYDMEDSFVRTEIFESDPFTPQKGCLFATPKANTASRRAMRCSSTISLRAG